jgi:hypothetical protein
MTRDVSTRLDMKKLAICGLARREGIAKLE